MSPDDVIAANSLFWAAICGLLAIVAPWVALLFSRWAAVAVGGLLTAIGTIMAFILNSHAHVSPNVNIRPDVLIYPLLLVAWLECVGLVVFAALKESRAFLGETPSAGPINHRAHPTISIPRTVIIDTTRRTGRR